MVSQSEHDLMQQNPTSIPHTDKNSDVTIAQAHPGLIKVAEILYNQACELRAYGFNPTTSTSAIEEATKALQDINVGRDTDHDLYVDHTKIHVTSGEPGRGKSFIGDTAKFIPTARAIKDGMSWVDMDTLRRALISKNIEAY
jgi:hypothetical protein